ncbi:MAG: PaaI family thioesterase [Proteobacteria bacterium]|nr:PaaI family thioesterase [Pseudomonadota bacterium]
MSVAEMQQRLERSPFNGFMGLRLLKADAELGELDMRMELRPEFERMSGSGQFHGGILSAFIDTVGQYALMMQLGKPLATINLRVDYLRPAVQTGLLASARVWRIGRSVCVADVTVSDDAHKVVAIGRANYATPS